MPQTEQTPLDQITLAPDDSFGLVLSPTRADAYRAFFVLVRASDLPEGSVPTPARDSGTFALVPASEFARLINWPAIAFALISKDKPDGTRQTVGDLDPDKPVTLSQSDILILTGTHNSLSVTWPEAAPSATFTLKIEGSSPIPVRTSGSSIPIDDNDCPIGTTKWDGLCLPNW